MEPHSFGRKLGIGLRVASRIVKDRAAAQKSVSGPNQPKPSTGPTSLHTGRETAAQSRKRVAEGGKRFGKAFFGPLVHVAAVLWLEVTGVFFALFALFCFQSLWRVRSAYVTGPDHHKFLLYAALSVVFSYFCISSFFRARRKERMRR